VLDNQQFICASFSDKKLQDHMLLSSQTELGLSSS